MGSHISDIRTMRWEIHYVYTRSLTVRYLYKNCVYICSTPVDRPLPPFAAAKICRQA